MTYRSKKNLTSNHSETTNPNDAGYFQSAAGKVGVLFLDDLFKPRDIVLCLRRNHAYQPVVIFTWKSAKQESRPKFSFFQVGVGKTEQYKRSLAIREKALGPDHPDVALSLNNLAGLYKTQGQYAQAEPLYKRSLAIWEKALGPNHPDVAMSLNNLAGLYKTQGQYALAKPLYKRSLAIWEKALGPNHPDVATSIENMALLYRATNRAKEAKKLEQRAARIRAIKR